MSGQFLHNLLLFGRVLRQLGLDINPGRMMDLVSALEHIEIGNKPDFFFAARTLLVHDREDLPLFDEAYELFWRKPAERISASCVTALSTVAITGLPRFFRRKLAHKTHGLLHA